MKAKLLGKSAGKLDNIMYLDVVRYNSEADYTDGMLFINGKFECFTIEDELRTNKVYAETAVPDGVYDVVLRKAGRFHENYSTKFPGLHVGMLCVCNAPDFKLICENMEFQYILIHIGNDDDDTAGCLLVGSTADAIEGKITRSTEAYKRMYKKVIPWLLEGKKVVIKYQTL